jgi:hypothetical protein
MNALAPYIAALHQQDLLEQAELRARVRLARSSQPKVAAWRRGLGLGARVLSSVFASAARTLDPIADPESTTAQPAAGHGRRAMAA